MTWQASTSPHCRWAHTWLSAPGGWRETYVSQPPVLPFRCCALPWLLLLHPTRSVLAQSFRPPPPPPLLLLFPLLHCPACPWLLLSMASSAPQDTWQSVWTAADLLPITGPRPCSPPLYQLKCPGASSMPRACEPHAWCPVHCAVLCCAFRFCPAGYPLRSLTCPRRSAGAQGRHSVLAP